MSEAENDTVTESDAEAPAVAVNVGSEPNADTEAVAEPVEVIADPVLLASRDIARGALGEITDPQTIGADDGYEVHEANVITLFFECRLPGYPGWRWAAALTRVDEHSPVTVLEVELLPGEGAVLSPEWVPWSVRLAQYREAQARQAAEEKAAADEAAAELADVDDVDIDDDVMENDYSDFDGDIDGVDFEEDDVFDDDDTDDDTDDDRTDGDSDDGDLDHDDDHVDSDDDDSDDDDSDDNEDDSGDGSDDE